MLAFVCANAVATVFLVWTPSFLTDKFHYDLATAGLSGTVFIHSASFLAVPVAGWLADKLSRFSFRRAYRSSFMQLCPRCR